LAATRLFISQVSDRTWDFCRAAHTDQHASNVIEELQDASYVLPRAMVTGCAINYIVGLIGLISFIFNIGAIDDSLYAYGGQPWVAVIYRITGSKAATIVMIVVVAINVRQEL
jgi:choline transport protein